MPWHWYLPYILGAFPKGCALLYKTFCPGIWKTELGELQLNTLWAATCARLPETMPLIIPWAVLAREGQTCPWENGSEITEFALEIVLDEAVLKLGSCRLLHDRWMFPCVQIKLWILWTESCSVWCCSVFGLTRAGSTTWGRLSSASFITCQWGHFLRHNFSLN